MPFDPALERRVAEHRSRGEMDVAADALVRGYGPELYAFLAAKMNDEHAAGDAFSLFSEDVWRGLAGFRGDASLRTWAYMVARRAAARVLRADGARNEKFVAGDTSAERAAAHVRTTTAIFKRTDVKDRVRALRDQLTADEQELLILRVDRGLDWRDIARILVPEDATESDIGKHAALLRKRFERAKGRLKELALAAGIMDQ